MVREPEACYDPNGLRSEIGKIRDDLSSLTTEVRTLTRLLGAALHKDVDNSSGKQAG